MKSIFCFVIFAIYCNTSYSQTIDPKIQEVYGVKAQEFAEQNPDWLRCMNDFLNNRIEIRQIPLDTGHEKFVKLSEVKLLNKYNSSLQRDAVFDPVSFNPLKYDFVFSAKSTIVYRVDNTNYAIVIAPQSFK